MNLMKKTFLLLPVLACACAPQSTPSMVNTEKPRLVADTTMQQIPVSSVTDGYLFNLARDYERYGTDAMHLSLGYDPKSKNYGAMKAFSDLADIKTKLREKGVRNITAEAVKMEGGAPTLMVSYDGVMAAAPAGCRNMPGFDDGMTTRELGDYRFGCSIDTMLAKQIYRPADLAGNAAEDPDNARRGVNIVDHYRTVGAAETEGDLERLQRADMGAN